MDKGIVIEFFTALTIKLYNFFLESQTCRMFTAIGNFFRRIYENSYILRFLFSERTEYPWWQSSYSYRLINGFGAWIKKTAYRVADFMLRLADGSRILGFFIADSQNARNGRCNENAQSGRDNHDNNKTTAGQSKINWHEIMENSLFFRLFIYVFANTD